MFADAGLIVGAVGGALLASLGVFVASLRPRTRANLAFAAFAVAFGLAFVSSNALYLLLGEPGARPEAADLALAGFFALAGVALVLVAFWFPRPFAPGERRAWLAPAGVVSAYLLLSLSGFALGGQAASPVEVALSVSGIALFGAQWFALLVFAARFGRDADARARGRFAIASAGIAISATFQTGIFLLSPGNGFYAGVMNLAVAAVLVVAWLRIARGPSSALARNVALVIAGAILTGMLYMALGGRGGGGIVRALSVAVLAYGILKHQLLGIDLRVRWTISKGTLAGAFVGVFFVVSEGAQQVFATTTGSAYWGIAAAGALLFAISPLQRAADRLADAATGVRAPSEMPPDERVALYREQARLAWADGQLGRRERLMLNHLRRELRLDADTAERIEESAASSPGAPLGTP